MKLIGSVVDAKELDGQESLVDLLVEFTEREALIKPGDFEAVNESTLENIKSGQAKLRNRLSHLVNQIPLDVQREDIDKAMAVLANTYVFQGFGAKYPIISEEMFGIRRVISVSDASHQRKVNIEIPLFVSVPFSGNKNYWTEKIFKAYEEGRRGVDLKEINLEVKSRVPPITEEAREKAKQARVDYLTSLTEALQVDLIGDLVLKNFDERVRAFNLGMYWIPCPADLMIEEEVIDKDPILVASLYGKNFLIHQWDIKSELPYQHYLEEFLEK